MTRIVRHAKTEDVADDDSHPIPALSVIDVSATHKGGGGVLYIIIATPLDGSPRSQERLLNKIEGYLRHISSEQFKEEAKPATAENTAIIVEIHAKSDPVIFDLLERSKPWVAENNAHLKVVKGKEDLH